MSNNSFKIDNSLALKPQNTPPSDPQLGEIYLDSTSGSLKQYNGTAWEDLGGGSQSLNTFSQLYADNDAAWAKASGSGSSIFTISTTSPLSGNSSYVANFVSTNNDIFLSDVIDVPLLYRGNSCQVNIAYTYSGTPQTVGVFIYDVTNAAYLLNASTSASSRLSNATSPAKFRTMAFTIPSNCTEIKVGVGASGTGTITNETLKFDNVELGTGYISREKIHLRAHNISGQSIPNNSLTGVTNWTLISIQGAGTFVPSTGIYTVPETGIYLITARFLYPAHAAGAVTAEYALILTDNSLNEVAKIASVFQGTTASCAKSGNGTTQVYLTKDSLIRIAAYQNSGAARTLNTSNFQNAFQITKLD